MLILNSSSFSCPKMAPSVTCAQAFDLPCAHATPVDLHEGHDKIQSRRLDHKLEGTLDQDHLMAERR